MSKVVETIKGMMKLTGKQWFTGSELFAGQTRVLKDRRNHQFWVGYDKILRRRDMTREQFMRGGSTEDKKWYGAYKEIEYYERSRGIFEETYTTNMWYDELKNAIKRPKFPKVMRRRNSASVWEYTLC